MNVFKSKNLVLICLLLGVSAAAFADGLQSEYQSRGQSANDAVAQQIEWGINACMAVINKKAKRAHATVVDSEVAGGRSSRGAFTNTVYAKLSDERVCSCVAEVDASTADCR